MTDFIREWRFGFRRLRRSPGFSLGVVLTLALAMSLTSTMMSLGDALLLKPLPYQKPGQLVNISEVSSQSGGVTSLPNAIDWKEQSRALNSLSYYSETVLSFDSGSANTIVPVVKGSYDLFETLGVSAALGRVFDSGDDRQSRADLAILSARFWKQWYDGDASVIGRSITLNGTSHTIIGVMGPDFGFPIAFPADLWVPLVPDPELRENRSARALSVIARMRPGESVQSVEAEMGVLSHHLGELYPEAQQGWTTQVKSYDETVRGHLRPVLIALFGALALVFLIACANVAGLQLARVASQRRELSIKMALGASYWRVTRQILIECILLALMGAALGSVISILLLTLLQPQFGSFLPEAGTVSLNWRVGLFVLAQVVVCGLLTAIVPAFMLSRESAQNWLREAGASVVTGRWQNLLMRVLAASQVALTVVLLLATGLMLRTLEHLQQAKTGFETDNVLTAELWPSMQDKAGGPDSGDSAGGDVVKDVYLPLVERLGSLPGAQEVGLISVLPLSGSFSGTKFYVVGRPTPTSADTPRCELRAFTDGYLRALRIKLVAGRLPDVSDGGGAPAVGIVNDILAHKYFSDGDPIGKQIKLSPKGKEKDYITIVGVFQATVQRSLSDPPEPELGLPYSQLTPKHPLYPYIGAAQTNLVLRAAQAEYLAPTVRQVIYESAPELAVDNVRTMDDHMKRTLSAPRLSSLVVAIFGALAVVMAAAGLYGVIALWVSQRTRELGLRMALGATRSNILSLVGRQAALIILIGLAGGGALFLPLSDLLRSFLYGVVTTDTVTIALVFLMVIFIGMLSVLRPAWRAVSIQPNVVLRSE